MILDNKAKQKSEAKTMRDLSETNKVLHSMVAFRLTNEQLHKLKLEAVKEKRSVSNYIKTKLF